MFQLHPCGMDRSYGGRHPGMGRARQAVRSEVEPSSEVAEIDEPISLSVEATQDTPLGVIDG